MAQQLTNPIRIHKDASLIPGLAHWVKDLVLPRAVVLGYRCGSDPTLLWLWRRLAAAALIRPLAWELPYVTSAALKKQKIIIIKIFK